MKIDSTLSRRRLLASVPAVAAAGVPVAATAFGGLAMGATANPDAALIKLVEEWFAAKVEERRLREARDVQEEIWFEQHRKARRTLPALRIRSEDAALGIPPDRAAALTAAEFYTGVEHLRYEEWPHDIDETTYITPSPEACARADEIIAAFEEWQRKCEPPHRAYHVAGREHEAAVDHTCKLLAKILKTPARSLAGLAAKARIVVEDDDGTDEVCDYARSFARDLLAMNAA
jgi:hypothetical protein